ncbi:MAG: hypothetical protein A2045_09225 [Rhodocyclales bacterium GWA2_65_20]|nr:MAG: hypothetical protein A2045_09225 [Rhodocyclales bacterium GWA2_65_20]
MSTPPFDAGAVHLRLRWEGGCARDVNLRLERPAAAAAMRGRPAEQAVRMLPLLYSICGAAQGVAASLALRAARGEAQAPAIAAAVLAEARREHLWRLLLDWPRLLALPQQQALLIEGRRRLQEGGFDGWMEEALREPFARIEQALGEQAEPPPVRDAQWLPSLTAAETLVLWPRLDAGFAAAPTYLGKPAETGALARHPDLLAGAAPLLARVEARMADLAAADGLGCTSAAPVAPGVGRAAVETARGLLLHEITLDGDSVADYVIVAPTEWNFHAQGILAAWLQGAVATTPGELKALAARAVLALDPCVRCEIALDENA